MNRYLLVSLLVFISLHSQEPEDAFPLDSLPYDAVINSTLGGKRMKYFGKIDLNFSQAYFENWVSGGESSFSGLISIDYNFNYSDRNGWVWDNNLMISLGANKVSGDNLVKKADDRFEINSQLGKQINPFWNYAAYVNFRSQLLSGFRYYTQDGVQMKEKLSRIFSPTVIQLGLGWYYKKNNNLWVNISPLAGRGIFVGAAYTQNLAPGKKYFGVEKGKNYVLYLGNSVSGFYKFPLMENISIENKFNVYVNYMQNIQNVDFELNSTIRMKINKKISSNLIVHLLYDDDLVSDLQIRELFGLGLGIDL
ncbi:MAG: DUF3078 domain-containing protein [Flavobacteriaceae bacterium]|jgi:hypothetical protein